MAIFTALHNGRSTTIISISSVWIRQSKELYLKRLFVIPLFMWGFESASAVIVFDQQGGVMKGGQCPKCGSVDLTESRKARYSGPEGLQMISFNACRFVELYAPDESEQSQMHRQFVLALLIAIAIPLLIILIAVAFSGRGG